MALFILNKLFSANVYIVIEMVKIHCSQTRMTNLEFINVQNETYPTLREARDILPASAANLGYYVLVCILILSLYWVIQLLKICDCKLNIEQVLN